MKAQNDVIEFFNENTKCIIEFLIHFNYIYIKCYFYLY